MGRLKTVHHRDCIATASTSRRVSATATFIEESGDVSPVPFSYTTTTPLTNQIRCWLLHTNERVRDLVRDNISQSPLFNGQIQGIGPRYCPSLEDKIMRFPIASGIRSISNRRGSTRRRSM
jgi:tRNA uridine 5-carboxymethylaminomethyl modification enzyme